MGGLVGAGMLAIPLPIVCERRGQIYKKHIRAVQKRDEHNGNDLQTFAHTRLDISKNARKQALGTNLYEATLLNKIRLSTFQSLPLFGPGCLLEVKVTVALA